MDDQKLLRAVLGWDLVFYGHWKGPKPIWQSEYLDVVVERVKKSGLDGVLVGERYSTEELFVPLSDPELNGKVRTEVRRLMDEQGGID